MEDHHGDSSRELFDELLAVTRNLGARHLVEQLLPPEHIRHAHLPEELGIHMD